MPCYSYPFVKIGKEALSHPRLLIRVINPFNKQFVNAWGLIDTGADACLFPKGLATYLGHNLKGDGVKSNFTIGIEQKHTVVYKHTFNMELFDPKHEKVVRSTGKVLIDCSDSEPPILLGVQNFLKDFKLGVDYPNQQFTLSW